MTVKIHGNKTKRREERARRSEQVGRGAQPRRCIAVAVVSSFLVFCVFSIDKTGIVVHTGSSIDTCLSNCRFQGRGERKKAQALWDAM